MASEGVAKRRAGAMPGTTQDRYRFRRPIETRPFFMTSEFLVFALMLISLFIASAVVDDVDSRLAWILGIGLAAAYIVSRGIAKAGSRSMSYDPREDMLDRDEPLSAERGVGRRA